MAIAVGIFDRIFKREEKKELRAPCTMDLDDVGTWVEETSKKRQDALVSEMQPAIDEILQLKDTASEIVEEIRDYKPPPEIKKRMFKPVLTARPKYAKGLSDALDNIHPLADDTYDALVDFNARTAKALKIVHKTQLNQGHIIAMFFQEEIPRLGTAFNRIIDLQKSIEEGIEDKEEREKRTSGTKMAVAELLEAIDTERLLKDEAAKVQKETDPLEAKRAKHKEELKGLREGAAYRKLAGTEKELAHVQEKLATIEGRGRNLLGPLLRVLRKYARAAADRGTKRATDTYVKNPQTTFFEEVDGASVITQILNEVCTMAERGELALDKKEREKVDSAIANLGSIREEHTAVKKEEQRLKEALASSSVKREEATIMAGLKQAEDDIKRLYAEAENARSGAEEKEQEIKRLKEQLEEDMSRERETDVTIEI
ncbi:MAG: hypothetical protein V3V36_02430 [Candidatus Hydrothermarchaeaceae archaeon]